ncbi:muropeptide transporter [Pannonibacter phragmitetus]|uniref:Muropeptide transporter n=1 Tax=Pannonibacter phragmitetus TaxID=121719 RepID=A0A378ZQV4_9HYPH|nr:RhtX/FptX family siderophore transporter [Pannonibacter phragmitetus]SUA99189.1 muropeptide transporter [Pannonibacter phragmitetus]
MRDAPAPQSQTAPEEKSRVRLYVTLAGLYLAQGIPTYLIAAALPPVLREQGVSRTAIGLFSLLMLPLVVKFAWAPFVDRIRLLPIGHRRGWIVPMQLASSAALFAMAFIQPTDVVSLFVICTVISVAMSTQDIATDGYATQKLTEADRGIGNACQGGAVAFGVVIGGSLSLFLFEKWGWQPTLLFVAALSLIPLAMTVMMEEDEDEDRTAHTGERSAPPPRPSLRAFFRRPEAVQILIVALVFRASEGLVKAMEGSYLVDIKLPLSWIGYLSGASAATAGLLGSVVAVGLMRWQGTRTALITLGGLRTICFLMFMVHALGLSSSIYTVMGAAAFQTLIRYMEIVVLYSLFMSVASKDQPGTDFTILACAQLVVYLAGASVSGVLADKLGYGTLFTLSTALSGLAVLLTATLLRRKPAPPMFEEVRP